jgi:hypothetical protein
VTRGTVRIRPSLVLETGPWNVDTTRTAAPAQPRGTVQREASGRITLQDQRVTGAGGDWRLDGAVEPDGSARVTVDGSWPQPPSLLARLANLDTARTESLAEAWTRDGTPFLRGALTREANGRWTANVEAALPGPVAVLPASPAIDVSSLGALRTRAEARGDGRTFQARIDAAETAWVEHALVLVSGGGDSLAVDTVDARLFGASLRGSADRRGGQWRGHADVDVETIDALRPLLPGVPADVDASIAVTADFHGPASALDALVVAAGRARSETWEVPAARCRVETAGGSLARARVDASEPVRVRDLRFDEVSLEARPLPGSDAPYRWIASVGLRSEEVDGVTVLRISADGASAQVDTLAFRWHDRDAATSAPFTVNRGAGTIAVDGLRLHGTLGTLDAEGHVSADDATLVASFDLRPPSFGEDDPPALAALPRSFAGTARVVRRDSAVVDVQLQGLPPGGSFDASVQGSLGPGGTVGRVVLSDGLRYAFS